MTFGWTLKSVMLAAGVAMISLTGTTTDSLAGGKKHCPPGLAKKGSCTPPGLRKVWKRGDVIPRDYGYRVIVHEDFGLRRPGIGEVYIETGGRIYLLAEATQRVIEAINLIDAAAN